MSAMGRLAEALERDWIEVFPDKGWVHRSHEVVMYQTTEGPYEVWRVKDEVLLLATENLHEAVDFVLKGGRK